MDDSDSQQAGRSGMADTLARATATVVFLLFTALSVLLSLADAVG